MEDTEGSVCRGNVGFWKVEFLTIVWVREFELCIRRLGWVYGKGREVVGVFEKVIYLERLIVDLLIFVRVFVFNKSKVFVWFKLREWNFDGGIMGLS